MNSVDDSESARSPASACDIELEISGARFSPVECAVHAVTPGVPCGPNVGCPPVYSIRLTDAAPGHLRAVGLYDFKNIRNGTVSSQAPPGRRVFNGSIVLGDGTSRNLVQGEVSFESVGEAGTVKVSFDLSFPGKIRVRGSGVLPVKASASP